jgi:non-homologous end joining protein Ku
MTDEEARSLPVVVDSPTLAAFGSTTWATDAGSIDILDLTEALERSLQQQRPAKSRRKPAAKRKRKSA